MEMNLPGSQGQRCAVIIPFYQKEDGILRRALRSIFSQSYQNFEIIIVDDQSPYPLAKELEALDEAYKARITMLAQTNKGPGGARNTGLDAVGADIDFIAFLDSDDIWTPDHLANAHRALFALNGDCYWDEVKSDDDFEYRSFAEFAQRPYVRSVPGEPTLMEVDALKSAMVDHWWEFFHLSTFAARRPVFARVRFDERFRVACEDALFFFDCARITRKAVVSTQVGVTRGSGANLFHFQEAGTTRRLEQLDYSRRAIAMIERQGEYTQARDLDNLRQWKRRTREDALSYGATALRMRNFSVLPLLGKWVLSDPALLAVAADVAFGKAFKKR